MGAGRGQRVEKGEEECVGVVTEESGGLRGVQQARNRAADGAGCRRLRFIIRSMGAY
jgi:hypothetical protein